MSRACQKVFRYILENLMHGKDNIVILNPVQVCQSESRVHTTYDRSIKKLLYHKVIAKSINLHIYFVNPIFIICKGKRFAMYTEYVQKTAQLEIFEKEKGQKNTKRIESWNCASK